MRPLKDLNSTILSRIAMLLVDIDGTLTYQGRLCASAYSALENLQARGLTIVPVTGRPAGWCDHIARMWPVNAVIGENGAFYFRYHRGRRTMIRRYWDNETDRRRNRERIFSLANDICHAIPGAALAADQAYRATDLAIDYCEDVAPLPVDQVARIAQLFSDAGARAKISSLHVNGWFGNYDKLAMTEILFRDIFDRDLKDSREEVLFVGDSPNDEPLFAYFPYTVGVANIRRFAEQLQSAPEWITEGEEGVGFAELAEVILAAKTVEGISLKAEKEDAAYRSD